MDIGLPELLIILVIVLIIFGGSCIRGVMGELGKGIAEFRSGLKDGLPEEPSKPADAPLDGSKDSPITR